jgi:hypothetical protein
MQSLTVPYPSLITETFKYKFMFMFMTDQTDLSFHQWQFMFSRLVRPAYTSHLPESGTDIDHF